MTGNAYGLRLLRQPGVRLAVLVVITVVVLAFRALQFARLTREIQWGYDFSAYWAAAANLLHGQSPYTAQQLAGAYAPQAQYLYLYPPPLAALVTPLAAIFPTDYRAAAWMWTLAGAAVLVAVVLALHRTERLGDRFPILSGRGRWLLVAAAFAFPPVVGELVLGNVHLFLLGLLTLAWIGIRRTNDTLSGAAVGVASVIKVFPGVTILWFLLSGRSRAVFGAAAAAAVLVLVTLPLSGIEPWLEYPTVLANLSAPSDTTDTLAPAVWLGDLLGFTAARIIVTAAGLALVAWAARRLDATRGFAIAVTVSVLIAPALYHHYLALLVLPLILGLAARVDLRWLAIAYFLMWGGQQAALGDLSWIVNRGMPTAGALVLVAGMLFSRDAGNADGAVGRVRSGRTGTLAW